MKEQTDKRYTLLLIPVIGVLIFFGLYFVATLFYPGGSQVDHNSTGFSWINNYWCNLLNEKAINGEPNPSKPIALAGLFVLCLTLAMFWILLPSHINLGNKLNVLIQISVIISMTIASFLFTNIIHDLITNLATLFGLIALIGTFIGLYKTKWYRLFVFGLLNILLVGVNTFIYYTKGLLIYLPIIQKISFATFLIWVSCINLNLFYKAKSTIRTQNPVLD